jgi:hypothetical protein
LSVYNATSGAVCAAYLNIYYTARTGIDISIPFAAVNTIFHYNCVAVIGIVNRRLDVIKIRRAVVIDGNYSGLAGDSQQEAGKDKNRFVHFNALLKGSISGNILLQK